MRKLEEYLYKSKGTKKNGRISEIIANFARIKSETLWKNLKKEAKRRLRRGSMRRVRGGKAKKEVEKEKPKEEIKKVNRWEKAE